MLPADLTGNLSVLNGICEKIAKGLEDAKIAGSANVIAYAMKE